MRTLVIGDIHHRTRLVDRILRRYSGAYDQIVFLGDYLDDYDDSPALTRATCRWLVESLQAPNRIHLLGNHDLPYFCPENPQLICPGWSPEKQKVFNQECSDLDRDRLHLAAMVGPWLLSHAGFSVKHARGETRAELIEAARRAKVRAFAGIASALLCGSPARGFPRQPCGPGITWMDFEEEFRPVDGLHQIVGHTTGRATARSRNLRADGFLAETEVFHVMQVSASCPLPQPGPEWRSVNWCLDCLGEMVGLLDDEGLHLLPSR
jgi:hypothetical protein